MLDLTQEQVSKRRDRNRTRPTRDVREIVVGLLAEGNRFPTRQKENRDILARSNIAQSPTTVGFWGAGSRDWGGSYKAGEPRIIMVLHQTSRSKWVEMGVNLPFWHYEEAWLERVETNLDGFCGETSG